MATWINDLKTSTIGLALRPQAVADPVTGTYVDCVDLIGNMTAVVSVGTIANGGYLPKIEEADKTDDTGLQTVTPLDAAWVEITSGNHQANFSRTFKRTKRFVRISVTEPTPGANGGPMSGVVIGMRKNVV